MERTLIFLKPDAVQRGLVGEVISRFERKGFNIIGLKLVQMSEEAARRHYAVHQGKPFYESLVQFITSGPIVAMALEGKDAVAVTRQMMGATFCGKAAPGTIRGDYGLGDTYNLIHGSDGPETAQRELAAFFSPDELVGYAPQKTHWVYDRTGKHPV